MAINWDTATAAEKTHEMNMLDPSYTENYYASGPTTDYVYPTGGVAGPPAPYTPSQQAADQQTKATSISQGTYWDEKNPAPNTKSTKNTKSTFNTKEALKSLGYVNKNSFKKETGYSSVEQYLADQRKKEQARVADQRKKEQAQAAERQQKAGQIGRAWDPILAELDAQIGRMPGQQAEYQNQLGGLADLQLQDVEQSANTASTSLEAEKKKGLRSLEEDMRNQMDAAGRYIGGLGGGNSSAGMQASEAVTRAGQKARGGLLETVTAKLGEIQTTAQKARSDVQNWKAGKLFEITQFFAEKMNELSMQKANSKGEKAKAIEQLKFDIEKELAGTLRDLDNQVIGYATTLDQWERERSAQLEDYERERSAQLEDYARQQASTASPAAAVGNWTIQTAADGSLWRVNEDTGQAEQMENTAGVFIAKEEPKIVSGGIYGEPGIYENGAWRPMEGYNYMPQPGVK